MARVGAAFAALVLAAGFAASAPRAAVKPVRPWFTWLHMTSVKDGYALSGRDYLRYVLLRTTDRGRVWHKVTPMHPSAIPEIRGSTILFSRTIGRRSFAVERSDDGGRAWKESLPIRNRFGLGAGTPHIIDRTHLYLDVGEGVAAGSEGEALYTSSDGGHSWRLVAQTNVNRTPPGGLPFGCDKDGFGFATPSRGWAGGFCAGGGPFFLRTNDGGRHWHPQALPGAPKNCQCFTSAPVFFDQRTGVTSASGIGSARGAKPFSRVYWTTDGGEHWRGSDPTSGRTGSIDIVSPRVVWLFGRLSGDSPRFPRIYRTVDAGHRWSSIHLPIAIGDDNLDAVNARLGFETSKSVIWRTSDGGHRWTTIHAVIARR